VLSSDRSCSAARIVFGKSIINLLSKHFLLFDCATKRRCQRVSGVSSEALVFKYLVTECIRKRTKSRLFQQAAGPSVLICSADVSFTYSAPSQLLSAVSQLFIAFLFLSASGCSVVLPLSGSGCSAVLGRAGTSARARLGAKE